MAPVVDAKRDAKAFLACKDSKGDVAQCTKELTKVVNGAGDVVRRECYGQAEDFQKCFAHRFTLSTCGDDTVNRLLACHQNLTQYVLKP
mmetsp:Transcript_2405/g.5772  ORF Transcript_2405/g.5772 Transcript_2405/m.5772 type:complete len:89 (+) Transcript_2405:107-373(+)